MLQPRTHLSQTNSTQASYSSMASVSALAPAPISESSEGSSFTRASSSWRTLSPWGWSRDALGWGSKTQTPPGSFSPCSQSWAGAEASPSTRSSPNGQHGAVGTPLGHPQDTGWGLTVMPYCLQEA